MKNLRVNPINKKSKILKDSVKRQSILSVCTFKGNCMLNYSKHSILDGDKLYCEKDNLINSIIDGTLKPNSTAAFVIHPFGEEPFVSNIKNVESDKELIEFSFLNPDKKEFQDKIIHVDNISAVFKITAVSRLMGSNINHEQAPIYLENPFPLLSHTD